MEELDKASGLFGEICGSLFVYRQDEWAQVLWNLGFFLGKFIFLVDAWDDWEKDWKKHNYNPFFALVPEGQDRITEDVEQTIQSILTMMMAEAGQAFERLPILDNIEILRNILYSGVWCRYYQIGEKRRKNQK